VRRIRAKRRDDFRPAVDSNGVEGAVAYREVGSEMLASIVFLFCSKDVGALGLVLALAIISTGALGRLWGVSTSRVEWLDVGLIIGSGSGAAAVGWACFF
jgi:hypothetical protein